MNISNKIHCDLCPKNCFLAEGEIGFCGARTNQSGMIKSLSYGRIIALALDPVEKKPLSFFYPGHYILSAGSFGCNMNCPFCQNYQLARASSAQFERQDLAPDELIEMALKLQYRDNIGLAFTYNEPTINFEYVRDSFALAKRKDLKTVLVTNGQIKDPYLTELLPLTDAWNIDLKSFSEETYKKLGGDLATTLHTIQKASECAHAELTTLIVPGISDNLDDFERELDFISELNPAIPLHLSRYYPSYHYQAEATSITLLNEMKNLAEDKLEHVLLGNV